VLGQHLAAQQGSLGVVGAQFLLLDPVDLGPLGPPAAGEDPGAADDPVGVDAVDPDAVRAELGREQPDLVGLVGLRGRVGDVVRAGEDGVLAGDVDDVAAELLRDQHPGGLPGDQERALGHHVVLQVPVPHGGLQQRRGQRQPGVVDHQVDPAEGQHPGRHRRRDGGLVRHVGLHGDGFVSSAEFLGDGLRAVQVEVGDHDTAALGGDPGGDRLADPGAAAGDQGDAGGQRLGLRHPGELGLFQGPVLDAELLRLVDRGVGRHRLGTAHHVDGVDVELAGHPCGLLVLAEGEHAHPGHQHDRRVRPADRRRVGRGVAVVVGPVVGPVGLVQLTQPGDDLLHPGGRRQVDDQRLDLGAQEVVRAGRAQLGQRGQLLPGQEIQHDVAVGVVPDLRVVGGGEPPDRGEEGGRPGAPLRLGQRLAAGHDGAEGLGTATLGQERLRGTDDLQRVGLGLLAGVAPCGDAVPAQHDPDGLRVGLLDRGDVQAELESGPAPRHPGHPGAEALLGELLPVDRGGQGDPRVGVQVVDVRGLDQAVHGGVDRRCGTALAVQAVVEGADHLVLALDPRVDLDEAAQPVQAQHREVLRGQRAEIAARSLHPDQLHLLPGDRVGLGALGGGVPAGVVGVAGVAAEPVGAGDEVVHDGVRGRVGGGHADGSLEVTPMGERGELRPVVGQDPQLAWVPPTRSWAIRCP
jgi:hypothetical protein